jgi:hypothetical protein
MKNFNDLVFELPVYVSIESPSEIKPYAYVANSKVEVFTVLNDNWGIVEQLNDLHRFRQAVLKALVDALKKTRNCEHEEGRYAWIKVWAGYSWEAGESLDIQLEKLSKDKTTWSISWSKGNAWPNETFRSQTGGLALALRIFRVILERQTARWLSRVPFTSPA